MSVSSGLKELREEGEVAWRTRSPAVLIVTVTAVSVGCFTPYRQLSVHFHNENQFGRMQSYMRTSLDFFSLG